MASIHACIHICLQKQKREEPMREDLSCKKKIELSQATTTSSAAHSVSSDVCINMHICIIHACMFVPKLNN